MQLLFALFEGFFFIIDLVKIIAIEILPGKPEGNFVMLFDVRGTVHR
jgi:hypothetical protein